MDNWIFKSTSIVESANRQISPSKRELHISNCILLGLKYPAFLIAPWDLSDCLAYRLAPEITVRHVKLCSIHAAKPLPACAVPGTSLTWLPALFSCWLCPTAVQHMAAFHMQNNHSLPHTPSIMQRAAWLKNQSHFQTTQFSPFSFSHLFGAPFGQEQSIVEM